ncbi:hypothetical protein B2D07_01635 [Desulfococcus multivorans]|nr:uncharacterized protein Dmul_03320 [Desulfococcus multivorans]AQU99610.1 hypothetical protein B2D07_01635 [Desulfococcus multivorans]
MHTESIFKIAEDDGPGIRIHRDVKRLIYHRMPGQTTKKISIPLFRPDIPWYSIFLNFRLS